jgi:hypothetical protein
MHDGTSGGHMIRTQVQLTEAQARILKELAHQERVSIAELTRRALDYWLQSMNVVPDAESRRRALAIVGRFRSDRTDVSERHDDYLAEAYDA